MCNTNKSQIQKQNTVYECNENISSKKTFAFAMADHSNVDDKVHLLAPDSCCLEFWHTVNQFYLDGVHCDLSLRCSGGQEVRCHRIVLSALSPMVRVALRMTASSNGEEELTVITLPDLSHKTVRAAIDKIYSFLATQEWRHKVDHGAEEVLGIDFEAFANRGQGQEHLLVKKEEERCEEEESDWLLAMEPFHIEEDGGPLREDEDDKIKRINNSRIVDPRKKRRAVKRNIKMVDMCEEQVEEEEDYFSPIRYDEIASKATGDKLRKRERPRKRDKKKKKKVIPEAVQEAYACLEAGVGSMGVEICERDVSCQADLCLSAFVGLIRSPETNVITASTLACNTSEEPAEQFVHTCNALRSVLGLSRQEVFCQDKVFSRLEVNGDEREKISRRKRKVRAETLKLSVERLEEIVRSSNIKEKLSPKSPLSIQGDRVKLVMKKNVPIDLLQGVMALRFYASGEIRGTTFNTRQKISEAVSAVLDVWSPDIGSKLDSSTSNPLLELYLEAMAESEQYSLANRMLADDLNKDDQKAVLGFNFEVVDRSTKGARSKEGGKKDARVCELCGLECPTPRALYRHKFNNHTERECKYCSAKVVGTLSLISHMRRLHPAEYTGHNKTPAVCPHCGKTLGSADSMRRHVLMVHTEEGDKPCKCSDCPRGFPNPSALRAHVIMAHVRNRPFACRMEGCAVAYNDNASLHTHERKAHGMHHNSKRSRKKSHE